jgi:hypothetical protein
MYAPPAMTTCLATPDRCEAGLMRCAWCGLFWETTDPHPPRCRVRDAEGGGEARPHDDKSEVTRGP